MTTHCWTPAEARAYFNCSQKHVYRLLKRGRLPAVKLGRDWRIDSEQLRAMFAPGVLPQ